MDEFSGLKRTSEFAKSLAMSDFYVFVLIRLDGVSVRADIR